MEFKDFIQAGKTITICYQSRDERKLLDYLIKIQTLELWLDNPFYPADLLENCSQSTIRDYKINQVLADLPEIPTLVVDWNMIALDKYKLDYIFLKKLIDINRRKLVLLFRTNQESFFSTTKMIVLDNVFQFQNGILTLIKSREYDHLEFDTNL